MSDTILFQRLEEKRITVEQALREATDPQAIHELNDLLDMLTVRLCQVA